MAIVRLELELDSEIYPELHAALSALSPRARAERLRQLAAAGLVWEKVRIQGAAIDAPSPPPPLVRQTAAVIRADVAAARAARGEPPLRARPERRSAIAAAANGKQANGSAAFERRRSTDFVDLAINAEPTPVPLVVAERQRPQPSRQDVEQVLRELPVLSDVVDDDDVREDTSAVTDDSIDTLPPIPGPDDPAAWTAVAASAEDDEDFPEAPPPVPDTAAGALADDEEPTSEAPEAALHVTALAHKPQARSRLKRMKERGLFKNG